MLWQHQIEQKTHIIQNKWLWMNDQKPQQPGYLEGNMKTLCPIILGKLSYQYELFWARLIYILSYL